MRKKKLLKNLSNLNTRKYLFFFILLPYIFQAQIEKINSMGKTYCSRNVLEIIKKKKEIKYYSLPEDFSEIFVDTILKSSYTIAKRKYKKKIYNLKNYRIKMFFYQKKTILYIKNFYSKKNEKVKFIERCDIVFTGVKYKLNGGNVSLFFKTSFDGYEQYFSYRIDNYNSILNFELPYYRECD